MHVLVPFTTSEESKHNMSNMFSSRIRIFWSARDFVDEGVTSAAGL